MQLKEDIFLCLFKNSNALRGIKIYIVELLANCNVKAGFD